MARFTRPGALDEVQRVVGDETFVGLDMKTPDPGKMVEGALREAYNVRLENGGLKTRGGCLCPGSLNYVSFGTIYGTGVFSDPNGLEWIPVAAPSGVWFSRDGEAPRFVAIAEVTDRIQDGVEFLQAFDQLILFRGPDKIPLIWDGDWTSLWKPFPPPTGGRKSIPNASTGEFYANRIFVPYDKDRVAVSDIGDYTEYDWILQDFQINTGQADRLVRIFPWVKNTLIMFKDHSIFVVSGVEGDLSGATLDQISVNLGLVGRRAVVQVASDIYFVDRAGIYKISQVFETSPKPAALPISDAIKPIIDSINWAFGLGIRANYRRERLYFAVPLKNARRNNALLVYNLISESWESIDTVEDPTFRIDDLIKIDHLGERRLFAVDRLKGLFVLLEQGKTDLLGLSGAFEYPIVSSVLTRGYSGPGTRNNFRLLNMNVATWNPRYSVEAFMDGDNAQGLTPLEVSKERTRYYSFGTRPWNPLNTDDDHGRAQRKDYSVHLPLMLGHNGVQIEREQETSERFMLGLFGRYCQLRIINLQGSLNIRSLILEDFEDQRQPRTQS